MPRVQGGARAVCFATAAAEWIPIAKDLLRMVGLEADMADVAWLTDSGTGIGGCGSVTSGAA